MMRVLSKGFTMVELIIVISIIGILAIIAIPKLVNLQDEARLASLNGLAGALASASAVNYMASQVNTAKAMTVENCADVGRLLQGGLPSGYEIPKDEIKTLGVPATCTLKSPGGVPATTFIGIRTTGTLSG